MSSALGSGAPLDAKDPVFGDTFPPVPQEFAEWLAPIPDRTSEGLVEASLSALRVVLDDSEPLMDGNHDPAFRLLRADALITYAAQALLAEGEAGVRDVVLFAERIGRLGESDVESDGGEGE